MASTGLAITNSGTLAFVYNNMQANLLSSNSTNTNGVLGIPQVQGYEPQSALQMTARQPGGTSFRAPNNSTFVSNTNTNAVMALIGGDLGMACARMGYTKGGAFLSASNSNGTAAVNVPLTNTQTNTNAFYGDTTFNTAYVMIFQNFNNIDGISSGNASYTVAAATNANGLVGFGIVANTNGNYAYTIPANGSTVVLNFPQGITVNASSNNLLITPTNGGVLACVVYGS